MFQSQNFVGFLFPTKTKALPEEGNVKNSTLESFENCTLNGTDIKKLLAVLK